MKSLEKRVTALRVEEVKCNIAIIGTVTKLDGKIPEIDEFDWEKAGRA